MRLFLAILLLLPLPVLAAGVEATPAKIEASLNPGKSKAISLTVRNPSSDVQLFEVYADSYSRAIKAAPSSFTLESSASRGVELLIDASELSGNTVFKTDISVVSRPLASARVQANAGIKIPLTITLGQKSWPQWTLYVYLAIILLSLFTFLILKLKKTRAQVHSQ